MTPATTASAAIAGKAPAVRPCPLPSSLGMAPSFGFGDRLGLGTPGHLAALREAGGEIRGVFAQQSVREMTRTGRSPETIMQAAHDALARLGHQDPWSADGDHLKNEADIRRLVAAGFVLYTLDPSEYVDQRADDYDERRLREEFVAAREHAPWVEEYKSRTVRLDSGVIELDERTLMRAAVKYGRATMRAIELARAVEEESARAGRPFEIELSVDETAHPTTAAEHYIIAEQFRKADVQLASLAPRFVGDFEKGVDYKGDLAELEASMRKHAEIAQRLGPYKLSLHSGSDKMSMYPALARVTGGRFHVKTSGTSYLEALRVAAQHDSSLFREIVDYSRTRYDQDKASYHVTATVHGTPAPEEVSDSIILERIYLDRWEDTPAGRGFTEPGRQILHCTFGSVFTNPRLGPRLVQLLQAHPREYAEILRRHFVRHLQPLNAG